MLCFPNCKINIGLYITSKRNDGYHNIETVFYPVAINDVLEIISSAETKLHLSGITVPGDDADNLARKAYNLIAENFPGKVPLFDIFLHKIIPMGAGLGGGSADGAFMLRLLNSYCELGLNDGQLIAFALQLGSDCPFFILNSPQFAAGRGEQMSDLPIDLSPYSIQLICPGVHISTGTAFGMITPKPAAYDLRQLPMLPVTDWKEAVTNAFETFAFSQYPALAAIKQQLYSQGAIYAAMSGSGSSIYGIFPKNQKAEIASAIPHTDFYIV